VKKLRLLLFAECNRNCPGCCNNDWDLDALETEKDFSGYSQIMLTGGEPMIKPDVAIETIAEIRKRNLQARIYLYTAWITEDIKRVAPLLSGITITLHNQDDVIRFKYQKKFLEGLPQFSRRLNIFKGVTTGVLNLSRWIVKDNMEWIPNCPLPTDEVFRKRRIPKSNGSGYIDGDFPSGKPCKYHCLPTCHPAQIGPEWVYGCTHKAWPANRERDFPPIVGCGGDQKKCEIPEKIIKRIINGKTQRIKNAEKKIAEYVTEIAELTAINREREKYNEDVVSDSKSTT